MYVLCHPQLSAENTGVFPWKHWWRRRRSWRSGGVRELILVAQETTLYGVDLYGEKKLAGAA